MSIPETTAPPAGTGTPRTCLVVRGGWDGHQPVEATDMFLPYLRQQGFEVRIEDSPAIYADAEYIDRKSTRLNSSHVAISYAVFCLKKKNRERTGAYSSGRGTDG